MKPLYGSFAGYDIIVLLIKDKLFHHPTSHPLLIKTIVLIACPLQSEDWNPQTTLRTKRDTKQVK